ncbi:putative cytochrome P450 136 [Alteripontixanthobacter maritimus]|uniref:Putative cytochrome P450 136 n=1 Tax=Alteripontixanthobacter maritimus TaxID=2161824 RepID=A0A369Q2R3_9SPHN|nr:cytochrome P450 [Alteripontixanthobacter maritimus]RDC59054.1 putative cytochrome P450 136 [Alteripontixanthobacter maritimus]
MASVAAPTQDALAATRPEHWSQGLLDDDALAHIPGEAGMPFFGHTFTQLRDPHTFARRMYETYGPVYKVRSFGRWNVALMGADANELMLFDRGKIFSSKQGWGPVLDKLFPRGLMLIDFDHHRVDRRALSIAFKPGPMRHYADALNRGISKQVEAWGEGAAETDMRFYPAIKQLTLDLAAESFIGLPFGPEADRINQAFVDMVQASVAPIRKPLPFTKMKRGVDGRAYLVDFFTAETLKRRGADGEMGQDMFSQFATATREDGTLLPVDEVVDHMNFLMMAAHDTITSSATSLVYLLAKNPEWQEKLRAELMATVGGEGRDLTYDDLGKVELTEMAFKEALRLIPPVPSTPRRALESFEFKGYTIPAGANVGINAHLVHHLEEHWPDPTKFDPMRFTPELVRARHKYAWVPFGGGAHMCLGLHFAYMQTKVLMAHMLTRYRVEVADGYDPAWQAWPIPQPKDGMQIRLVRL